MFYGFRSPRVRCYRLAATLPACGSRFSGQRPAERFPQWNCACPNCRRVARRNLPRQGAHPDPVAISADSASWFLLGASPDLRAQIEATPELHPREGLRQSPIAGAVLFNADIDHVLGLLLLRELQPLRVYATESVRRILSEDNSMFAMLQRVPGQLTWTYIRPGRAFPWSIHREKIPRLRCRAISLARTSPLMFRRSVKPTLDSAEKPHSA